MATHSFVLSLRVTAKQYADAVRQLRDGNVNANPLALAFIDQVAYILSCYNAKLITLVDIATGLHCSGAMPAVLADYLSGFQRGVRVLEDHEFELVLMSKDD